MSTRSKPIRLEKFVMDVPHLRLMTKFALGLMDLGRVSRTIHVLARLPFGPSTDNPSSDVLVVSPKEHKEALNVFAFSARQWIYGSASVIEISHNYLREGGLWSRNFISGLTSSSSLWST